LPLNYFESRYVGDIISRVQENRKIQQFLTGETLSILLDMLTMFVYAGLMFWYSWKLALLVLIIVPPFILLALIYSHCKSSSSRTDGTLALGRTIWQISKKSFFRSGHWQYAFYL